MGFLKILGYHFHFHAHFVEENNTHALYVLDSTQLTIHIKKQIFNEKQLENECGFILKLHGKLLNSCMEIIHNIVGKM